MVLEHLGVTTDYHCMRIADTLKEGSLFLQLRYLVEILYALKLARCQQRLVWR
jgi:hypothetical protein